MFDDQKPDQPKTIVIAQTIGKQTTQISNDDELTDEYLDSILPSVGYKIVPPPPGYVPIRRERKPKEENENKGLPQVPNEFIKLYTDLRPDEELSPEEKDERFVMKLLIQIKDGTTYQRKMGLRILLTHAEKLGSTLIFSKLLPLLTMKVLNDNERHSLVKAVDRLMNKLASSMAEYVPQLLASVGNMLIERDSIAKAEAREIISNLAKIGGLPVVLKSLRSGLDSEEKSVRAITAQTIATASIAVGIPSVFNFLRACINSKRSWKIKHTCLRIIDSMAYQSGSGVLPHLSKLITIVKTAMTDSEPQIVTCAIKTITTLAEAVAPNGGNYFIDFVDTFLTGIQNKSRRVCLRAIGAVLMTINQEMAMKYFKQLSRVLHREFQSQSNEDKLIALVVFERAIQRGAIEITQLSDMSDSFFKSYWNPRAIHETNIQKHLTAVTTEIAKRSSVYSVLTKLFYEFKNRSPDYRRLVVDTFDKIMKECGTATINDDFIIRINDNLLYAFNDIKEEQYNRVLLRCYTTFIDCLGSRVKPLLSDVTEQIHGRLNAPDPLIRRQSAQLLVIFSKSFVDCGEKKPLIHFYSVVQELLLEENPEVLACILEATAKMVSLLKTEELDPKPEEIVIKVVPILKNRNDKVSYQVVSLIKVLSVKCGAEVHKKEWMRICFELLELLKADKKKVRNAAIESFASIAKAISPFDVLLALLNNLQVQERQIRLCTTVAIAVLAQNCGTYNVLPALMNEYRTPDANVQNGTMKALQFLFQTIGSECANYCYSVTPLLTHALIERDAIHRQIACQAVRNFAIGCFAEGKEDALIHLFNHLIPNIFESTLHFIDALMDSIDAMRLSLGPGIVFQYTLAGLFHPARKVRSQYWRIFNNTIIYSGDALVPYYPLLENTKTNNYHRDELDVFV